MHLGIATRQGLAATRWKSLFPTVLLGAFRNVLLGAYSAL
jgi:hypothetical protein